MEEKDDAESRHNESNRLLNSSHMFYSTQGLQSAVEVSHWDRLPPCDTQTLSHGSVASNWNFCFRVHVLKKGSVNMNYDL